MPEGRGRLISSGTREEEVHSPFEGLPAYEVGPELGGGIPPRAPSSDGAPGSSSGAWMAQPAPGGAGGQAKKPGAGGGWGKSGADLLKSPSAGAVYNSHTGTWSDPAAEAASASPTAWGSATKTPRSGASSGGARGSARKKPFDLGREISETERGVNESNKFEEQTFKCDAANRTALAGRENEQVQSILRQLRDFSGRTSVRSANAYLHGLIESSGRRTVSDSNRRTRRARGGRGARGGGKRREKRGDDGGRDVCRDWKAGRCNRGSCMYAHGNP